MTDSCLQRDQRDPEKLGRLLSSLTRTHKVPVLQAADELTAYHIPDYVSPDTLGRYGRPNDVKPLFMEVQVR